jgi:mannose-6-phosphate isomerase-like protein (cupin superfamily)
MTLMDSSLYQKIVVRPPLLARGKQGHVMLEGKELECNVQVVAAGGETNIHAHAAINSLYYVLSGEATFFGGDGQIIAVLRQNEGLYIPHDTPYGFENARPEEQNLVLLQCYTRVPGVEDSRTDYSERQFVVGADDTADGQRQMQQGYSSRPVEVLEGRFFGDGG